MTCRAAGGSDAGSGSDSWAVGAGTQEEQGAHDPGEDDGSDHGHWLFHADWLCQSRAMDAGGGWHAGAAGRGMRLDRPLARIGALLAALAALFAVYFVVARPWFLRWGATDLEVTMRLPGDDIVPDARDHVTRAITINAPADRVWPWLTQIGQDRGGFYSYQWLENMVGCEMPDIQHLDPRLQHWKVGDKLWMYPPSKAGGAGFAELIVLEPGRALGFGTRQIGTTSTRVDGSWTFVVLPVDAQSTRLIFRGRGAGGLRPIAAAFTLSVFEPVHFAMERRMLVGLKAAAEGRHLLRVLDNLQVALWAELFVTFVVSAVLVCAGKRPGGYLLVFTAAGTHVSGADPGSASSAGRRRPDCRHLAARIRTFTKVMSDAGDVFEDLQHPQGFGGGAGSPVTTRTTHASWVFIVGDDVWKVKRPGGLRVPRLPNGEARRHFCEEEVRLNRRLAPDVYRGVEPVRRGAPRPRRRRRRARRRLGGAHAPAAGRRLGRGAARARRARPRCAGASSRSVLAAFLASAPATPELGTLEVVRANVAENFAQVAPFVGDLVDQDTFAEVARVPDWVRCNSTRSCFVARVAERRIRDGHGDLRLEHVYFVPGRTARAAAGDRLHRVQRTFPLRRRRGGSGVPRHGARGGAPPRPGRRFPGALRRGEQ